MALPSSEVRLGTLAALRNNNRLFTPDSIQLWQHASKHQKHQLPNDVYGSHLRFPGCCTSLQKVAFLDPHLPAQLPGTLENDGPTTSFPSSSLLSFPRSSKPRVAAANDTTEIPDYLGFRGTGSTTGMTNRRARHGSATPGGSDDERTGGGLVCNACKIDQGSPRTKRRLRCHRFSLLTQTTR